MASQSGGPKLLSPSGPSPEPRAPSPEHPAPSTQHPAPAVEPLPYQAQDAARAHRRTAERTLRDYASFAALQFYVQAKEGINSKATWLLFRPMPMRRATIDCGAPGIDADTVRYSFLVDLRSRDL